MGFFQPKFENITSATLGSPNFVPKKQNNPMISFLDLHQTHVRMDGWTEERDLIGPNRSGGWDQKSSLKWV